jgi:hypothetical protein
MYGNEGSDTFEDMKVFLHGSRVSELRDKRAVSDQNAQAGHDHLGKLCR